MGDQQEGAPDTGAKDANSHPQTTTGDALVEVLDRIFELGSRFRWVQSEHQPCAMALWLVLSLLIGPWGAAQVRTA